MAAYGCKGCGVNWPNLAQYSKCPLCEEKASYNYIAKPDLADAAEVEEYISEQRAHEEERERAKGEPTAEHKDRVARYLAMRDSDGDAFTEGEAGHLARATWVEYDSKGREWVRALDPVRVARTLASGCPCARALEIFT